MFGIFDEIFDLNHDGQLDDLERAAEAAFVTEMIEEESVDEDERTDALEEAGLDSDDYEELFF